MKHRVLVREINTGFYSVEAESPEEAKQKVEDGEMSMGDFEIGKTEIEVTDVELEN